MKELHHYNASNRLRALSEFSHLFANQSDAESWISIIIPEIIEHLLDIEREPRVAVVEIFRVVIQRFKIDALRFIAPVVVSYISSGLSNIHKGVRKQSLILLCIIAEGKKSQQLSGFELIQPFIKNLSDILLSLLNESLKSSFIPTSLVAADSSKKHSTGEGFKINLFSLVLSVCKFNKYVCFFSHKREGNCLRFVAQNFPSNSTKRFHIVRQSAVFDCREARP